MSHPGFLPTPLVLPISLSKTIRRLSGSDTVEAHRQDPEDQKTRPQDPGKRNAAVEDCVGSFVSSSQLLNLSGSHTQRMAMPSASPPVDLVTKDNNAWPGVLMAGRHRCSEGFHVSAIFPSAANPSRCLTLVDWPGRARLQFSSTHQSLCFRDSFLLNCSLVAIKAFPRRFSPQCCRKPMARFSL